MADPGQPTLGGVYRGVKWEMYLLRIPLSCLETPIQAFPPPPPAMHPNEASSAGGTQPAQHPTAYMAEEGKAASPL